MPTLDFWFSIGSTYSCLTVLRMEDYASHHRITVNWRPFDVRRIMIEQKNIPFANKPEKTAYMWRDIERRAQKYGMHLTLPAPYPIKDLPLANQIALLGMTEGWGIGFTVELYKLWFISCRPAGDEPVMAEALRRVEQDPDEAMDRARQQGIVDALTAETETARTLGVFGAPSFVTGTEVFWGDDRLDDATEWARNGRLSA